MEILTMAKFCNTSTANYFFDALIKDVKERLSLITFFIKSNEIIKTNIHSNNRIKYSDVNY